MTNRLELNWKLDGFVDEQRYYCSETAIDLENLPSPKAVLAGDLRAYVDTDIEVGKTYYICVGSVKNSVEKLSEILATSTVWQPKMLGSLASFSAQHTSLNSSGKVQKFKGVNANDADLLAGATGAGLSVYSGEVLRAVCDRTQRYLIADSKNWLNNKNQWYVLAVLKPLATTDDSVVFSVSSGGGNSRAALMMSGGAVYFGGRRLDSDNWQRIFSPLSYGNQTIVICGVANTLTRTLKLYINGSLVAQTNTWQTSGNIANTNSNTDSGFLSYPAGSGGYSGDFMHFEFSNTPISIEDIRKFEGWAAHNYGLTEKLPVDHPYKILAPAL